MLLNQFVSIRHASRTFYLMFLGVWSYMITSHLHTGQFVHFGQLFEKSDHSDIYFNIV